MKAPCTADEAVKRGLDAFIRGGGIYWLGAGNFNPAAPDYPFTATKIDWASDCRFACCFCWKLEAHQPGYNHGAWATVSDDLNYNSLLEDGEHARELCEVVDDTTEHPKPGDIIAYPTIELQGHTFIGHGALVIAVPTDYRPDEGFHRLTILQVCGPNGRGPAILKTDGTVFDHHTATWPKPEHRTRLVRMKDRT